MSRSPPQVIPRNPSAAKRLTPLRELYRPGGLPIITDADKKNGNSGKSSQISLKNAEREVEILNHCFDDIEKFMLRLQQTGEAQSVLNQRTKRSGKKSTKNNKQDDLLAKKAIPPSEQEFVDIFQKIKYSFCLLDHLKSNISQPDAPDLLHSLFVPLSLMVKTTQGPTLAALLESPGMTRGAVSLLQKHLTEDEKELWKSLGPKWTSHGSQLSVSAPPYSPVFLDGWQPQAYDSAGQLLEDPIQLQHKEEALSESRQEQIQREHALSTAKTHGVEGIKVNENGSPPNGGKMYRCSYGFVARNSNEISVLHGETVQVLDTSGRWWKCQNGYNQIGLVDSNILEPMSAVNNTEREHPVVRTESKNVAVTPQGLSYAASSRDGTTISLPQRHHSMILSPNGMSKEDSDRVMVMNNELMQRLAKKNSLRKTEVLSPAAISIPLDYHSSKAEVKTWLIEKGFDQRTVQSLGVLNGAQLFSLNNEELCSVCPSEGESVYLQLLGQKALLEDWRKTTEKQTMVKK